ncbi:hypothetical protein ACVWY2_002619 [Bradyrhizobium sp. JR6.1]
MRPDLSQAPLSSPPEVLIRCTVATLESRPLPRWEITSSFSQGMSAGVAPGALPAVRAVTALPSTCSQFGPA